MTAIVETFRKTGFCGDLKIISIQTSAAAATGHTIDLKTDATDGKGMVMTEILNTKLQDDTGTDVGDLAFDPATGIITLPSVSTGIHNIFVIGYKIAYFFTFFKIIQLDYCIMWPGTAW